MSRKHLIYVLTLATLFAAIPARAQEYLPFEITKDKKLLVKVKVEGKQCDLIVDTGAVDLLLDPSIVGMKPSELKGKGPWNPNGPLKIAERMIAIEIVGRKFGIMAAILDCKRISEISGKKVDGIIGIVILEQFKKVTIDFEKQRLEFL